MTSLSTMEIIAIFDAAVVPLVLVAACWQLRCVRRELRALREESLPRHPPRPSVALGRSDPRTEELDSATRIYERPVAPVRQRGRDEDAPTTVLSILGSSVSDDSKVTTVLRLDSLLETVRGQR